MTPFFTMEMMKYAAQLESSGTPVLHLEVGQPIVSAPKAVIDEAIRALNMPNLGYCSALGYWELREAIAQHYKERYDLNVSAKNIIITPGSSIGLYLALKMNFKRNARIAIAAPSYPCYRNVINSLEYIPVEIETTREENYLITVEKLAAIKEPIAGILIASPNNPTGSMYDSQSLKELSEYCEKMGICILSDELYHGITFDKKAETVLKYNEHATVVNGFSKYFAMTGWRLGWMVVPEEDVSRYESLLQNLILCTSTLTQIAAVKAFSAYEELDKHVNHYQQNINILHNAFSETGISVNKPDGAIYLYAELDDIKLDSMDFCKKLLAEKQVAVSPGMDFSSKLNKCAIRLSVCQPQNVIIEAASRLKDFINLSI